MSFFEWLRGNKKTPKAERAKHRRGMMRVAAYFTVTTALCTTVAIRHAHGEYKTTTLTFGKQMLELANARNHEVTKLTFNGQPMWIGASSSKDDPKAVIARYEEYCKKNPGQPSAGWEEYEQRAGKVDDVKDSVKTGVVRAESDEATAVTCFVKGPATKATVEEAIETLLTTGELGALGELRYAYARKDRTGNTLVLTAWTDSTFNLNTMMGDDDKDAPGSDFAEIPRLPRSVRMISARAEGAPYGVNVYKTTESPAKALAFFDATMHDRGFTTYDPQLSFGGRSYFKDGVVFTVASYEEPDAHYVAVGLSGVTPQDKLGQK